MPGYTLNRAVPSDNRCGFGFFFNGPLCDLTLPLIRPAGTFVRKREKGQKVRFPLSRFAGEGGA